MPQAPTLPPELMQSAGVSAPPVNPINFLMAAAEAHSKGEFQSAPVPSGVDLQTGHASRRKHLKVMK